MSALAARRSTAKAVPAASTRQRPQLAVVPRRRRAAGFVVFLSVLVVGVMLGAAVLHTSLAERQLRIDELDRSVAEQEERFDVLRQQRAELRSPTRLAAEAGRLGMRPAAVSEFVEVDPVTLARAIAATGQLPTTQESIVGLEPLDQFILVKEVRTGP